jgi:predicted Zn-dependent peptidase
VLVADRAGAVQTAIFATQPFPRRDVPGWEARELLMQVTGGLFTSRLNQNLREKHAWTYGAGSSAAATRQWGAVFVSTSVERSVTADALAEIVRELGELRAPTDRPIQAAELARARADLANAHGAQLEDVGRVAADVAELYVHSLAANHLSTLPARVAAVPGADVQGAASALLPERLLVVVVGDRASIEADLRGKGFAVETAEPKLWQ